MVWQKKETVMAPAFNAEMFCNRSPDECVQNGYHFAVYQKQNAPASLMRVLMHEFSQNTKGRPPDENKMKRLCRGAVEMKYLKGALNACENIAVGYHGDDPIAVILSIEPSFISPVTKKAICLPHELYIDVVCAYFCYRACGAETIRRFLVYARSRGVRALRLYATSASKNVWADKWGFQEAETIMRPDGTCVYGPRRKKGYPGEESNSHRMTLILNAENKEQSVPRTPKRARRRAVYTVRKRRRPQ